MSRVRSIMKAFAGCGLVPQTTAVKVAVRGGSSLRPLFQERCRFSENNLRGGEMRISDGEAMVFEGVQGGSDNKDCESWGANDC